MTVEELLAREEIHHLMATYNTAGDSLRVEEFGSVFSEDATLDTGTLKWVGRENIVRGLFPAVADSTSSLRRPKFVRHNLTTSKITFSGENDARGRTYFQVNTDIGLDHCGVYSDEFHRVAGEWKIRRRVVRTEYWSDDSYFKPASNDA